MKYFLRFSSEAEKEIAEIFSWYSEKSADASFQFTDKVDDIMSTLAVNPFIFPSIHKDFRIILLDKFPYSIIYEITGNFVVILRIYHHSRNPKKKFKDLK